MIPQRNERKLIVNHMLINGLKISFTQSDRLLDKLPSMKYTWILIFINFLSFAGQPASAQNADLQKSVQEVIEKYRNAPSLKLDFQFQLTFPEQEPQIFDGIFYKLNEVYKVDLDEYTIYSDGKIQHTVQKKAKEVQITNIDSESIELSSPAGILKYLNTQEFKYFDKSALSQEAEPLRIIELIPTDKTSEYFKIRFSFTETSRQLKYIEIFAKDGHRIQLSIGETSFSGNFSRKSIEWNSELYKDYYIEDLRID